MRNNRLRCSPITENISMWVCIWGSCKKTPQHVVPLIHLIKGAKQPDQSLTMYRNLEVYAQGYCSKQELKSNPTFMSYRQPQQKEDAIVQYLVFSVQQCYAYLIVHYEHFLIPNTYFVQLQINTERWHSVNGKHEFNAGYQQSLYCLSMHTLDLYIICI